MTQYIRYPGTSGGGSGTVTSVSLVLPSGVFTVSGSPVTTTGTFTGTFNNQSANTVFAGPTSGSAAPTFRALVAADVPDLSATYVPLTSKGSANGVASLDGGGKIPVAQLPNSVFIYQGTWNPNTNTPSLVDGTGTSGYTYWVSAAFAGPVTGLNNASMTNFQIGDLVLYNGTQWELTTPAAGVTSVNSSTGAVTVNAINQLTGDVTASAATGSQSKAASVASIQGTAVGGTTGSGNVVFSTSPTLVTPALGTPSAVNLLHGTNLPLSTGVSGTLPVGNGGTGSIAAATNGHLLIGAGTSYSSALPTAGALGGVTIVGGAGTLTLDTVQDIRTSASPTFATVTTTTGLVLPTSGGTPSTLNFYEEWTGNVTWVDSASYSQTVAVKLVRVGGMVVCRIPGFSGTSASTSDMSVAAGSSAGQIPTRFLPVASNYLNVAAINNSGLSSTGLLGANAAGFVLYNNLSGVTNQWAASGTKGLDNASVLSWVVT